MTTCRWVMATACWPGRWFSVAVIQIQHCQTGSSGLQVPIPFTRPCSSKSDKWLLSCNC